MDGPALHDLAAAVPAIVLGVAGNAELDVDDVEVLAELGNVASDGGYMLGECVIGQSGSLRLVATGWG